MELVAEEPEHEEEGPRSEYLRPGPVLVVDDDHAVRQLFSRALSRAGLETVEAADGAEALELISRQSFAVVLLDSWMPGVSGLDVIRSVRARPESNTLPIILVTGQAEVMDRVSGLEAGANDYLIKPVHLDELVARVRAHMRERAVWLHVVDNSLRERSAIARALSRIAPETTAERTSEVICRELSRLRNLTGVALLAFGGETVAVPLAQHGVAEGNMSVGEPLPPLWSRELYERALQGPWISRGGVGPMAWPIMEEPGGTAPGATAYAPLRSHGELLGLLVITAGADSSDEPVDYVAQSLSAAIDFAAIASALLAPAVHHVGELEAARAGIERLLAGRAFFPVFQPIVELSDRSIVGYEALTRFADGKQPQKVFTDAARLGLGLELESATLTAALEAARALPPEHWLSMNVSPALLTQVETLKRAVASSSRTLVLELTEHDPIDDYATLLASLSVMKPEVELSVDDAGSGYACLGHILALNPRFVKLDHSWVRRIDSDPARQALVVGLAYFAQETGCRLIAEGIETEEELLMLRRLGVRLGQGFLLGRPEPVPLIA